MSERAERWLSHFSFFAFEKKFFELPPDERRSLAAGWLDAVRQTAHVELYQVYPAQAEADVLLWSSVEAQDEAAPADFFARFARATNPFRRWIVPRTIYWGLTRPSQYTKTRSAQEMDPFAALRKRYLVLYPFVKTSEWYLKSREARQGMMNEHIRIGKQYPNIQQLLLYSFGLQDQEFIVVYEMDELPAFSELVQELRGSEARRYTERDTPLQSAVYHPAEETLSLWS